MKFYLKYFICLLLILISGLMLTFSISYRGYHDSPRKYMSGWRRSDYSYERNHTLGITTPYTFTDGNLNNFDIIIRNGNDIKDILRNVIRI